MNAIFKKLNYKDQKQIYILQAPKSFEKELEDMRSIAALKTNLSTAKEIEFFLAFVTKQKEVDDLAKKIALLLKGDGTVWFAYPKGTSKKYTCEFNRDNGWVELGKNGFEPVRMVAIDEDWSALRFRKVENIKTMTRSVTISDAGRKKSSSIKKGLLVFFSRNSRKARNLVCDLNKVFFFSRIDRLRLISIRRRLFVRRWR